MHIYKHILIYYPYITMSSTISYVDGLSNFPTYRKLNAYITEYRHLCVSVANLAQVISQSGTVPPATPFGRTGWYNTLCSVASQTLLPFSPRLVILLDNPNGGSGVPPIFYRGPRGPSPAVAGSPPGSPLHVVGFPPPGTPLGLSGENSSQSDQTGNDFS